jgi:hypothetical protein
MQAAAMRGVDADRIRGDRGQPSVSGAFCAVTVHHIRRQARDLGCDRSHRRDVAKTGIAAHRNARGTKGQMGSKFGKNAIRALSSGQAVGDEPDLMPLRGLTPREIDDVTE